MSVSFTDTAILLLAAGGSTRLGQPKQLLQYKEKSLLAHVADEAIASACGPVFVVLGASMDLLAAEIKGKEIRVIENSNWKEGMASSIRCGLEKIEEWGLHPEYIMIVLCDQPYISAALIAALMKKQRETKLPVIASNYDGAVGTPALFHRSFFQRLKELKGDKGAQTLIKADPAKLAVVSFPGGGTDIDTKEDYEWLKKQVD